MAEPAPPETLRDGLRGSRLLRGGLVAGALILALAGFQLSGFGRFLSLDALAANREWLLAEVARLGVLAAAIFIAVYLVVVALSVPGALVLTITGGFLFGPVLGSAYAVVGGTLGAIALFLFVRIGLGDAMRTRAGSAVERLRRGFAENAMGYLLFLRLLPIFPFWLVNLAAALLAVPLRTFVIATAIGIIPGSIVYASFGSGIGSLLDADKPIDLQSVLAPEIVLPLAGLAVLALAPALYRRLKSSKGAL